MNGTTTLLTGLGLGAAAMYLLDPERGRTRRAFLTQKLGRVGRVKAQRWEAAAEDAKNRLIGMWNKAASKFSADDVSDQALEARVRAAIGREVSHPGAIGVMCKDGVVELSGDILALEVRGMLDSARDVKGVKDIVNRLNVHDEPGNISALQGEGREQGTSPYKLRPGPALGVGLLGLGLLILGATRQGTARKALGTSGALLVGKSMVDLEGKQMKQVAGIPGA